MESIGSHRLEEWKVNLDLLKFYETLKQQRFAHFLSIQTAFLAIFGLLAKEAIGVFSLVTLAALAVIPVAPLVIAFYFTRLERARARFRGHGQHAPAADRKRVARSRHPTTHSRRIPSSSGLLSRRDAELVDRYVEMRGVADDPYLKCSSKAPSAHASESAIIRLFLWVWLILFSAGLVHLAWHLLHPQWATVNKKPGHARAFSLLAGDLAVVRLARCVFVGGVLDVADALLHLAFDLLRDALDLLGRVAGRVAELLLSLARDVLGGALHLVRVHAWSPICAEESATLIVAVHAR